MSRGSWDDQADTFDDEPDHGLLDPLVHEAWRSLLSAHLPPAPADVVDLGCGTGTLSLLLTRLGHRVRGCDLSPRMVERAREKVPSVAFAVADAATPPYDDASCDVVLVRHVLWALPDPCAALARWVRLLRPDGRLLLVEGDWSTGAGIAADRCEALVREHRSVVAVEHLTSPAYWGRPVDDERYLLVSPG